MLLQPELLGELEIWLGNCSHQKERLLSSLEKIGFHWTELWALQNEYWERPEFCRSFSDGFI